MKPTKLYRIAATLLILFGVLHTIGFLRFVPPTPDGQAALAAMNNTHLETTGRTFTYGMFYRGFGLFLTVYLFFCAYIAWYLGDQSRRSLSGIGTLPWGFAAFQLLTLIGSWLYFPAPPIICSAVIFLCATAAAATLPSASAHGTAIP
jgi:hypothetical protein